MGIFETLQDWLRQATHQTASQVAGQAVGQGSAFLDWISKAITSLTNAEGRRQAAFTIAMIALSAKMAKADGVVTHDEVRAFGDLFDIPQQEQANVARVFNLAKQDIAGFESYAARIARLYEDEDQRILEDVLDGLFHIAKADGLLHEDERAYLARVADIFGFGHKDFATIMERHIGLDETSPYRLLGVSPTDDLATIKAAYRAQIRALHPDQMIARGVPPEFVKIANDRLAAVNAAFESIEADHKLTERV